MDLKELLPLLTGVAGGAGGVLTTIWKSTQATKRRLDQLRADVDQIRRTHAEFRAAMRLELDDTAEETGGKFADVLKRIETVVTSNSRTRELVNRSDTKQSLEDIKRRIEGLEEDLEKLRDHMAHFVKSDTFQHFEQEQQEQWLEVQRNLGQIEGLLRKI